MALEGANDGALSKKKAVFKIFAKFTEKHLRQISFYIKFHAFSLQLYLKRDFETGVFL